MGRTRVLVTGLVMIVGLSAILAGVRTTTQGSTATLETENAQIPDANLPVEDEASEPEETGTTFDLGLLVPSTTDAPKSTTTEVPRPTTTVAKNFAIVHVNNTTATPVKVWFGDDSEHVAVLPAGEGVNWVVLTSPTDPDRGGATVNGTNCGGKWTDANNVVGGREYHFEVKPTVGFCANGQVMPKLVITDYTAGSSKTIAGPVPNALNALLYVVNNYDAPVKVTANDDVAIEWTLEPGVWGAPQLLKTAVDQGDGASVTRTDSAACRSGDGENYFLGGHTYRIEVVVGAASCGATSRPGLVIYDLTTGTSDGIGVS